jgi:hypothetical protein
MKMFKLAAVAVLTVIVGLAMNVHAGTQTLLSGVNTGGWTASAPSDANVGLQVLGVVNGTLFLKKHAVFSEDDVTDFGIGAIPIQFLKGRTGVNKIVIDFEELGNETGKTWNSFSMTLLGQATFADSSANFNGDAFSKTDLSSDKKVVTLSDGLVHNGESFFPGFGKNGGDLTINATGSFSLNEQPTVAVPLPAAAWTGLSGLVGLGLLGSVKKIRKIIV